MMNAAHSAARMTRAFGTILLTLIAGLASAHLLLAVHAHLLHACVHAHPVHCYVTSMVPLSLPLLEPTTVMSTLPW